MKVGVISDTHGYLDPKIATLFKGVDHILHAGDIGYASIILELESLAPVTAVAGNNDPDLDFKETEVVVLNGKKILLHHIVNPNHPDDRLSARIKNDHPDLVVFGHTHQAFWKPVNGIHYLNPGFSGKPGRGDDRTVALLEWDETGPLLRFLKL